MMRDRLVEPLFSTSALWVRIQTSLKNIKWAKKKYTKKDELTNRQCEEIKEVKSAPDQDSKVVFSNFSTVLGASINYPFN